MEHNSVWLFLIAVPKCKVGSLCVALLQDWMRVVSNDSKVLSVVNRRRGEKGYRLLQGENLRSLLLSLVLQQVNWVLFLKCKHLILI